MRIIGDSSEEEMVACFLLGELTSHRFGPGVQYALAAAGKSERLLTEADLADPAANRARRELLAVTRGYGENRDVFEGTSCPVVAGCPPMRPNARPSSAWRAICG